MYTFRLYTVEKINKYNFFVQVQMHILYIYKVILPNKLLHSIYINRG